MLLRIQKRKKKIKYLLKKVMLKIVFFSPKNLNRFITKICLDDYQYDIYWAYDKVFRYLSDERVDINIIEFGVGGGGTACFFLQAGNANDVKINSYYGFDSFEGLQLTKPEDEIRWKNGEFASSETRAVKLINKFSKSKTNIKIKKALYSELDQNDLPKYLGQTLLHIDCDLYSSTIEALNFIKEKLKKGTIILLDDYFSGLSVGIKGEKKAIEDFCIQNNLKLTKWFQYAQNGMVFIVN